MDEQEWTNRLKAGIGGSKLWRLREKTAISTARDLIAVGQGMVGVASNRTALDSVDAMGFLLQMAGELMRASASLLSDRDLYAGAALLRQITEIEYLTWAIKENYRSASPYTSSNDWSTGKGSTQALKNNLITIVVKLNC